MLAICIVCALAVAVVGSAGVFASADRLLPIYCVETDKKQIAISFDAAWGNSKKVQNNIFLSLYKPIFYILLFNSQFRLNI